MTFNFSDDDPRGRKVWFTPYLRAQADGSQIELYLSYAGLTNKPYTTALAVLNKKTGNARRIQRGQVDAQVLEQNLNIDRELFPKYIITDWRNVFEDEGKGKPKPVKFSPAKCREFLDALPQHVMQEVSNYAGVAANFLPESAPDELDDADQAKN